MNFAVLVYHKKHKKNCFCIKIHFRDFYVLFKFDLALFKNNEKNTCEIFLILD